MRAQAFRIMEALSGTDEELLARCERKEVQRYKKNALIWRYAGPWAAVVCLALAGAGGWRGYQLMKGAGQNASGADREGKNGWIQQEMYDMEKADAAEEADGAYPEEWPTLAENTEGAAEYEESTGNIENAENADGFEGGQAAGVAEDKEYASAEGDGTKEQACMQMDAKSLTQEEARDLEGLGVYVPQWLPEGYVFQEAFYYPFIPGNLTVVLSRGADSMKLNIMEKREPVSVVDVGRPETYDIRLYGASYGETVPEEYQETFYAPVFAYEDFSLEIVRSRLVSVDDADGADTPPGCFSVLYPEGVLVSFDGSGTAEEIWEMFCSMEADVE